MNFPIVYQLKNGTEVEVSQVKTFQKFVFDFFKNKQLFDSYTWTSAATIQKEAEQRKATANLTPLQKEALEIFWAMQK
ncbi:hypothetical protein [Flavisolibacter ginsenosidimutans]|uniref:Uncharacterized protein n=1 Tax=Flavisolibacter ginsenosidimutans TaxID=661481 RepID=A0A5B8UMR5_9BACT|nr:hypothetical protein [Flavisolibacter ginsenosidimutans]QEC57971.1 hypothetical protein FSB75_19345 [Flavisolibacter ginsenosidimutans]